MNAEEIVRLLSGSWPSLGEQISCAKRELKLRQNVYPRWVAQGRLSQENADRETERMAAIVQTLERLETLLEGFGPPPSQGALRLDESK